MIDCFIELFDEFQLSFEQAELSWQFGDLFWSRMNQNAYRIELVCLVAFKLTVKLLGYSIIGIELFSDYRSLIIESFMFLRVPFDLNKTITILLEHLVDSYECFVDYDLLLQVGGKYIRLWYLADSVYGEPVILGSLAVLYCALDELNIMTIAEDLVRQGARKFNFKLKTVKKTV